jgi:hypothetical protein
MGFKLNSSGKKIKVDTPKKTRQGASNMTKLSGMSRNTSGHKTGSSGPNKKRYRGQGR